MAESDYLARIEGKESPRKEPRVDPPPEKRPARKYKQRGLPELPAVPVEATEEIASLADDIRSGIGLDSIVSRLDEISRDDSLPESIRISAMREVIRALGARPDSEDVKQLSDADLAREIEQSLIPCVEAYFRAS